MERGELLFNRLSPAEQAQVLRGQQASGLSVVDRVAVDQWLVSQGLIDRPLYTPQPDPISPAFGIVDVDNVLARGVESLETEQRQYEQALGGVVVGEGDDRIIADTLSNEEGRLYRNLSRLSEATGVSVDTLLSGESFTIEDVTIGGFDRSGARVQFTGEQLLEKIAEEDYSSYELFAGTISPANIGESLGKIAAELEREPGLSAANEEALAQYESLQGRIDAINEVRGRIGEGADTPEQQVALAQSARDLLAGEPVVASSLAALVPRIELSLPELAPTLEDIDPSVSPEVRAALSAQASAPSVAPSFEGAGEMLVDGRVQPAAPAPAPAPTTMPPTLAPAPAPVEGAGEMLVDGRPQPAEPVELVGADAETQRAQFMAATATRPEMTVEEQIEAAVNAALAAAGVGGGTGGAPRLTAAEMRAANQTEVERLLAEQFGGFSFFLQKHRSDLQVGLTADGQVVAAGDPNATSVKNILDVIVDQGITAPTRVLGMLQNTEWWQKTDSRMREYDVVTADMSEAQKVEYLEPVLDLLRDEAQFLGFQLEPGRARSLAEQITRMGEETDSEFIRELLTSEQAFDAAAVTASGFAAARDEIVAMSKRYFTPIGEDDAAAFAEDIYVGTKTAEGVEQYFREMAAAKMPQLQNALNAGITPEQYFAPYKYEIERMLDRPNIDLYEEFGDVIQYIPDTGTAEARPMTLNEVRTYVRGLDEWQMSKQGKDSAAALAFAIGQSFGEVA